MSKLRCHISISLDGFVAGPNQSGRTRSARAASGSTTGWFSWPPGANPTASKAAR